MSYGNEPLKHMQTRSFADHYKNEKLKIHLPKFGRRKMSSSKSMAINKLKSVVRKMETDVI
jgi:hypothetical protein